jgi:hypothetical protein
LQTRSINENRELKRRLKSTVQSPEVNDEAGDADGRDVSEEFGISEGEGFRTRDDDDDVDPPDEGDDDCLENYQAGNYDHQHDVEEDIYGDIPIENASSASTFGGRKGKSAMTSQDGEVISQPYDYVARRISSSGYHNEASEDVVAEEHMSDHSDDDKIDQFERIRNCQFLAPSKVSLKWAC